MARISCRNVTAVARVSVLELYRRKDVYVAIILALVIVVPLASVNLFGVTGIVRYLKELMLLLIWLFSFVIGIGAAARQIPREIENRTIYPLLAKPMRRSELVLGKFAGAAAATGSSVLLFYACFTLLSGFREGAWASTVLFQAVLLHLAFVTMLTALAVCGSVLLTPSGNVTCCALLGAGMLLLGSKMASFAMAASPPASWLVWTWHFAAPHFEFFDLRLRLVHGWEPLSPATLTVVLLYGACYTGALLAAAVALFQRKRM